MPGPQAAILDDAFQRFPCHYQAVLPYNLNWMIADPAPLGPFLSSNPIIVADIGARGGCPSELQTLTPFISYYGFDADADECRRLNGDPPAGFAGYRVLPYYVGKEIGPVDFHLYKSPGESSRFAPAPRFQSLFNPNLAIEKTVRVPGATLDHINAAERLSQPDLLKLDTQGTELEILMAGPKALAGAVLVEVEVEFTEIYRGQPLFHDVARFMHENGFELLYLNRVFQSRKAYHGEARGQLTFGDALFGRRDDRLGDFSAARIAKYAVLLINYGHLDIAEHVLALSPCAAALAPALRDYFVPPQSKEQRNEIMQADKLLCRRLHERRTNKLPFDSDRSWPVR